MKKNFSRSEPELVSYYKKKVSSVELPSVANMDELATQPDESLIERLRSLDTDMQKAINDRIDPYHWEVEMCYVRRELQIRRQRHSAHETYAQNLEREYDLGKPEFMYPVADLDNSAFMV